MIRASRSYQKGPWVKLKELPFKVRLFVVVSSAGGIDWVISNRPEDPQWPTTKQGIEQENTFRWHVEQFHRDVKQLTGSTQCQGRKARSQRNHLSCCYFTWVLLHQYAVQTCSTLYTAHRRQWDEYLKAILRNQMIVGGGV